MQTIPLAAVPSQTLQAILSGQNCLISVYTRNGYAYSDEPVLRKPNTNLYFDLTVGGAVITTTAICLNLKRLLSNRQYLGVQGDFVFFDTQGTTDPQYAGLGSRYLLFYLDASDVESIYS